MSDLHTHLTEQIAENYTESLANLARNAERIAQADRLADKLASCRVLAIANGNVIDGVTHVWVSAYPITLDALYAAITRLGLVEQERAPYVAGEVHIRLQGYDIPLYCSPRPERPLMFPRRS